MQDAVGTAFDTEKTQLTQELNLIAEQIEAAKCELDDCRRETSQLRAKAASVSVSFENAKEELQDLLQSESGIQANSVQSPPPSDEVQDLPLGAGPLVDRAMLRAVTGQLEATNASVQEAIQERDVLLQKIQQVELDCSSPEGAYVPPVSRVYLDIPALSISEKRPNSMREDTEENSFDPDLIQRLDAQSTSRSSFRDDHARVWRDSTFPNISLLKLDKSSNEPTTECVSSGVVSERLFTGITAYTSTNSNGEVEEQCHLSNCGKPQKVSEVEFDVAKGQYASLVLEDWLSKPHVIKVIAPRKALERVAQLVDKATPKLSSESKPVTPSMAPMSFPSKVNSPIQIHHSSEVLSPKPSLPHARHGPRLSTTSQVLQPDYCNFLMNECVPHRFQECDLRLKYSTNRDGMSVHTLFRACEHVSPTIVAVQDTQGRVFGCYAASPWKSSAVRYYGTGESFVFSCKPVLSAYKWTRGNHFFQFSHGNMLAMGGGTGSHFALWVDEDLLTGTTSACSTFDSPPLTNELGDSRDRIDFDILVLEVWSIVPRSHHTFIESGSTS